jgi:hypothetical protein
MDQAAQVSVVVDIAEPWELAHAGGEVRRRAWVEAIAPLDRKISKALIRLTQPLEWRGSTFQYLVVTSRNRGAIETDLAGDVPVECSFVGQPDERATGADRFDTSWWRGGLAGTATLRAESAPHT